MLVVYYGVEPWTKESLSSDVAGSYGVLERTLRGEKKVIGTESIVLVVFVHLLQQSA